MPERGNVYETNVPNRLDRLPWSGFHWLVIIALGIAWVLDGLEVTIVGSLSGALTESPTLHLTGSQVGAAASAYLIGAVGGSLFFGWLTDRLGRKKLFTLTVLVYLVATIACGLSWNFWSFACFRLLTGAGIGGEYAAVNATIQELIPARRRGFTDLVVNGSFWLGAAVGALGAYTVLDPAIMPPEIGWRAAFIIGGVLGFIVLLLRRFLPESPRWLMTHGQPEEAERIVGEIEARVQRETGRPLPPVPPGFLTLRTDVHSWFQAGAKALVTTYRRQAWLGVTLMAAQAFCYNAVFFTYALVLTRFYNIASGNIGLFMLPFAIGNFLGPLVLGRLFDTIGRRIMITATYAVSGVLMVLTGWMFVAGWLDAVQQTLAWTVIFFVASAAASSAYLTVGESFPLEVRAVAISLFYAFGTGLGGVVGPALFGALIDTGNRVSIFYGYVLGGVLMVGASVVAAITAANAERRSLEDVAPPLSSIIGSLFYPMGNPDSLPAGGYPFLLEGPGMMIARAGSTPAKTVSRDIPVPKLETDSPERSPSTQRSSAMPDVQHLLQAFGDLLAFGTRPDHYRVPSAANNIRAAWAMTGTAIRQAKDHSNGNPSE